MEIGIPVAFDAAAQGDEDVDGLTRRLLRDRINTEGLLERCVRDVRSLLLGDAAGEEVEGPEEDRVGLVGDGEQLLEAGRHHLDEVVW